jgi:hypothetical protein
MAGPAFLHSAHIRSDQAVDRQPKSLHRTAPSTFRHPGRLRAVVQVGFAGSGLLPSLPVVGARFIAPEFATGVLATRARAWSVTYVLELHLIANNPNFYENQVSFLCSPKERTKETASPGLGTPSTQFPPMVRSLSSEPQPHARMKTSSTAKTECWGTAGRRGVAVSCPSSSPDFLGCSWASFQTTLLKCSADGPAKDSPPARLACSIGAKSKD